MKLILQQLVCIRHHRPLFQPVTETISAGQLLQVTGTNGIGKSTLLRMLAGLSEPDMGKVISENITMIHYLGHTNGLHPALTARENMMLFATYFEIAPDSAQIKNILKQAGLAHKADIKTMDFSAGQLRRLALARLLLVKAPLWILDEPATALDKDGKCWLGKLLEQHLEEGGMAVVATHEPLEIKDSRILQLVGMDHAHPPLTRTKKFVIASEARRGTLYGCPGVLHDRVPAWAPIKGAPTCFARNDELLCTGERCTFFPLPRLIYYNLLAAFREASAWLTPLLFSAIAITLYTLAIGPDTELLHRMAPSILWVTTLLAILLSIKNIFQRDVHTGQADLMLTAPCPLTLIVISKIISHWLTWCLPLILMIPLPASLLGLSGHEILLLMASLLPGTALLSLTGSVGAALVAGIRGHGLLLPVLVMPLYIPALIFGMGIMTTIHPAPLFAILMALVLLECTIAPWLAAQALRTGVNQ